MNIHASPDPARGLAADLVAAIASDRDNYIAVSGGTTPRELFRILATEYAQSVPWRRVHVFQVDERCVPPTDEQSNWKMLNEELLSQIPAIHAYRIEAERPTAAEDYEAIIRKRVPTGPNGIPRFDLVLLGMGADGHTASLFPGTRALEERKRLVVLNDVPQLNTQRITMTYPLIEAAAQWWFLVKGADKAAAFTKVKRGELPAGKLRAARWYVDSATSSS
jgi:6-phosphogluconolactonase